MEVPYKLEFSGIFRAHVLHASGANEGDTTVSIRIPGLTVVNFLEASGQSLPTLSLHARGNKRKAHGNKCIGST